MQEIRTHGSLSLYSDSKYPSTSYVLYGSNGQEILNVGVIDPIAFRVKSKPLAKPSDDFVRQDALCRERLRAGMGY